MGSAIIWQVAFLSDTTNLPTSSNFSVMQFPSGDQVISVPFSQVAIGQEFFWGGFVISRCNWGKKRSSKTADWRANFGGQLQDFVSWSYWKKNESVFIVR